LWRTKLPFCSSYFSVGEVGERYLVYADPPSEDASAQPDLPVVTILNRTSRIPAKTQPEQPFEVEDLEKMSRTLVKVPELNRADASQDISLLRRLRGCDCLGSEKSPSCLNTLGHLKETTDNDPAVAACCKCLRQYYRYSLR